MTQPLLVMQGIGKRFSGVPALVGASLEVQPPRSWNHAGWVKWWSAIMGRSPRARIAPRMLR